MTTTVLKAISQKSFYGKAKILMDDDFIILRSYNTDVLAIDRAKNTLVRLWSGWSKTTSIHINDFLTQYGFKPINKKEWVTMSCLNNETTYNIYISTGFCTHKSNIQLTEAEAKKEIERIQKNNRWMVCWYE